MAISLNSVRIFINVADAGSVTKAAEAMYISQPAVSKAVKSLEDDLGVELFHRDKKTGITLTDAGERILAHARQLMLAEEMIHQTAYLSRNLLEGTLRVASLPSGTSFFLARAIAAFRDVHPGVSVEVREGEDAEVKRLVAEHACEFGIALTPASEFESRTLMEDRIVGISCEPIEAGRIDLSGARREFLICESAYESVAGMMEARRMRNRHRFRVVDARSVRVMASCGLGVGLQAASIVPDEAGLHVYPVEPEVRCDLLLIANDFGALSPAAQAFIAMLE